MKNLILFLFMSFSLLFVSCSNDNQELLSIEETTNIEISLPCPEDLKTRAFSDGLSINNLQCYIYDKSKGTNSEPLRVETIPMHKYSGHMGALYSIQLPKTKTYELVLLATSCPQNDSSQKIYYNQTQRSINLNYDKIVANDEGVDCFWGVIRDVNPNNSQSYKVTLKRPYAQLNIGTKDLTTYNEMASSPLQSVAVGVNGVYTSMNLMDGSVSGKTNLSFAAVTIPSGQSFPVSGNSYLSMNYLLVNERTNVYVSMTVNNQTKSFDSSFNTIPLQRNYRTNIYGNLLTAGNDYKVSIDPGYDGSEDKEFDLYDLIFKVEDGTTKISLFYTTPSNEYKEFDLSRYIDSNNTVKITWEEIGIKDVTSIQFVDNPTKSYSLSNPIIEFVKFNIEDINITSFFGLFAGCNVTNFNVIKNWDTSHITDMSYMFNQCSNVISLDLSNFNTSMVTTMSSMFDGCSSLSSLDLSSFDTRNVENMQAMYANCISLSSLDLSSFDTKNVKNMRSMFWGCHSLSSLDLSSFDTRNVTNMEYMYFGCHSLSSLDLSSFDTRNVENMKAMFRNCSSLSSLDLSSFDTKNVKDMSYMFWDCHSLSSLDLSSFDTKNVTNMSYMFRDCSSLSSLDLSSFDTRNVENMQAMFDGCNATITWGPYGGLH